MNNPQPKPPYEIRKFFEASLNDLAKLAGQKPREYRESLKWFFIRQGIIKKSTTELDTATLEKMAEVMQKFYVRMNNTPPAERRGLDLEFIFNDFIV